MSLIVDIAGFGICQVAPPFSVMVVSVQQEGFQAWTVYRRFVHFTALFEQLSSADGDILYLPDLINQHNMGMHVESLDTHHLEKMRQLLDEWLQSVVLNQYILRTQSMYHFLCADANIPPPYLEIHWRSDVNCSIIDNGCNDDDDVGNDEIENEMDMEDMFGEDGMDNNDTVFRMSASAGPNGKQKRKSINNQSVMPLSPISDEHADINIQSISLVEQAEFLYDRMEEENLNQNHSLQGGGIGLSGTTGQGQDGGQGMSFQAAFQVEVSQGGDIVASTPSSTSMIGNYGTSQSVSNVNANNAVGNAQRKKTINLDAFDIIRVIGKGSFGKVFLVRDKRKRTLHALKVLKKDYIIKKNQVQHTKTENSVLKYVRHPFIVGCSMAFQTHDKLFFVLDYCAGGELFFHLGKVGRFDEQRSKFYAAQITLALAYVHSMGIIYRDLKPENVLIDDMGNIRLTDFGLSKEGVSHHSHGATSFCGTPEYIAPEVLLRQGHGRAVDWWSLGALLFEMLTGLPPFYSRNREVMFEKIMKAQLTFPPFVSNEAKDILTRLLIRDPKLRLGSGERDSSEITEHVFFGDVDWAVLATGKASVPWIPDVHGSLDSRHFDKEFTSMNPSGMCDLYAAIISLFFI